MVPVGLEEVPSLYRLARFISEGWCCDLGNFPKIRLSGKRLSKSTLANARSGLVSVFQRPEWKLAAFLGLYSKVKLLALAQPGIHHLDCYYHSPSQHGGS